MLTQLGPSVITQPRSCGACGIAFSSIISNQIAPPTAFAMPSGTQLLEHDGERTLLFESPTKSHAGTFSGLRAVLRLLAVLGLVSALAAAGFAYWKVLSVDHNVRGLGSTLQSLQPKTMSTSKCAELKITPALLCHRYVHACAVRSDKMSF